VGGASSSGWSDVTALRLSMDASEQIGDITAFRFLAVDAVSAAFADPLSEVLRIVRAVGSPR
jgi:hypothetical protein